MYRRPDHEARTPTPLRRISVRRDAAGWSSVVRRLHAERPGPCRAVLGRIHSCCCGLLPTSARQQSSHESSSSSASPRVEMCCPTPACTAPRWCASSCKEPRPVRPTRSTAVSMDWWRAAKTGPVHVLVMVSLNSASTIGEPTLVAHQRPSAAAASELVHGTDARRCLACRMQPICEHKEYGGTRPCENSFLHIKAGVAWDGRARHGRGGLGP